MLIPLSQAAYYAEQAGFSGNSLATILAISLRESGGRDQNGNYTGILDTSAHNNVSGASGLLQWNPQAWGDVSAYANDPAATYEVAFQRTNGGTNFGPWTCDTECGYASGHGITPTSPATVIGAAIGGQPSGPIHLPADFWSIVGSSPAGVASPSPLPAGPIGAQGPGSSSSSASTSAPANILGGLFNTQAGGINFLQNAGVGAIGLVLLLGGFLIIAAPPLVSAAAGAAGGEATGTARALGRGTTRRLITRARPSRSQPEERPAGREERREANASDFSPDELRNFSYRRRAA